LSDDGVKALVESDKLPNLKSLRLAHNNIGPEGARFIAESVNIGKLTTLGLSENKLGDEGLKYLAGSRNLRELEILDLRNNNITDEGAAEFSNSTNYPNIQKVELSDNNLTDLGKNALKGFLILNLIHKRIKKTDDGMVCDLSNLGIGDLECEFIANHKGFNNLTQIYLELN
jgi:Leucine-rich repeat (LRR) protein